MTGGNSPRTLNLLYRQLRDKLAAILGADIDSGFEAMQLLEAAGNISRERLLRDGNLPPPEGICAALEPLLTRRLSGEPLQYILGRWEFYGLPFSVGPGVLIPRPETEMLVDLALEEAKHLPHPTLLDLCSGSGCIPIAFGTHCPHARVLGVELSPLAMEWFQQNIVLNHAENVTTCAGDALDPPPLAAEHRWQIITSNPPYIATPQLKSLQQEVLHEPVMALDGGKDGLDFYRKLPSLCCDLLTPGGLLLLEIGDDQGEAVPSLLRQAGYCQVTLYSDLAGHPRIVSGRSPS